MNILDRRIGRTGFAVLFLGSCIICLSHFYIAAFSDTHVPTRPIHIWLLLAFVGVNFVLTAWRCHDFGKSGWHDFWTNQLPFVGGFVSLYEMFFKPGDPHFNAWGPPPRF